MKTMLPPLAQFRALLKQHQTRFLPRPWLNQTLTDFCQQHDRGYFTLVGAPGSGKSAWLAHLANTHPQSFYYCAQLPGTDDLDFAQRTLFEALQHLSDGNPEDSDGLSPLLQRASQTLSPGERLLLLLDAVDAIDTRPQPPGSNRLYLPRYLPPGVYVVLSRRPVPPGRAGLLVESPAQTLDLSQFGQLCRQDVGRFLLRELQRGEGAISPWLNRHQMTAETAATSLSDYCNGNFAVAHHLLQDLRQGVDLAPNGQLSPHLIAAYGDLWDDMAADAEIVQQLQGDGATVEDIAQRLDADEFDVQCALDRLTPYLHRQNQADGSHYGLFHPSFGAFVAQRTGE